MKRVFFICSALIMMLCTTLLLQGCYPDDSADVQDYDISVTKCAPDFSTTYQNVKTYCLVDSVAHGSANLSTQYDATILTAVETNLNGKGWTKVGQADNPDVIIFCSAVNTDVYTYWYNYWYNYWYYYYPYYYPYYPWSYGGVTYDYSEGTAVIQMNYTKADSGTAKSPVIWIGMIDGVMNDTKSDIMLRINNGINQCFEQSPYLQRN